MLSLQRGVARTLRAQSWRQCMAPATQRRSMAAHAAGAKEGDFVRVNYTGTLDDGTEFDSSRKPGRTPLEFIVGSGKVIKGFDTAVSGLEVGGSRSSRIPPEDAYGEVDPKMQISFPAAQSPEGVSEGDQVQLSNGMVAKVLKMDDKEITLDLNHELAGKTLNFDVELMELAPAEKLTKATFGAGCFWSVELVYQRTVGVVTTEVGYCNGESDEPTYEEVCSGKSGHAEVVQVLYNPDEVSYEQLLDVFWKKHDPTTLNRQGGDQGTQYRSGIYFHSPEQEAAAKASIEKAQANYSDPIVTEVAPISKYTTAEHYHQQYLAKGGRNGSPQDPSKGCCDDIRCYG